MPLDREQMMKLQNGSDVRGVAVSSENGPPVTLTPEAVNRIAQAFVLWLADDQKKPAQDLKIGVGHDSRITASLFRDSVLQGVTAQRAMGYDCGLASTPSMFMSAQFAETGYDGAVMITASHLPYTHNGLKFFRREGGLDKGDIRWILTKAGLLSPVDTDVSGVAKVDLISLYAASLCDTIRKGVWGEDYQRPLTGLHIVVDAGNGVGGFFAHKVLDCLGADTAGSQFLEPDGMFPNHPPNPENKEAMASVQRAVVEHGADLGIIFDTDVDRMSAVLADGTEVNRDAIIAMMAAVIAPDNPGATVVTDSVTSHRLTRFLQEDLGMRHHRFQRGYKNVINEAKRLCAAGQHAPLAIETSGHGALEENYFLDDGAYMAVKIIIAAAKAKREGKTLNALIAGMPTACEEREYRLPIQAQDFSVYGNSVLEGFASAAREQGHSVEPDSYEGVRLSFSGDVRGWALLRLSLHDPLMPLNMEGERPGDCDRIVSIVMSLLAGFDQLDQSPLEQ